MNLRAVSLAFLICTAPGAAAAQGWPGTKPLKFEVAAAAGGVIDFVPRELASYLSDAIGVSVVVENRPGGGGNIAAGFVAKAEPDGHTLLVTGSNQAVNPTLLPNPGFDYERDLAPVAMLLSTQLLLVASPSFPAKNLTDVVALAKRTPKFVSIATASIGTPNYLAAEMLAQYSDTDLVFIPYDSISQAVTDLMTSRVDLGVGAIATFLPQVRSGALKALAVISPQRSAFAPDIPTSAEAGLPELQMDNWICVMTTGGTRTPTIVRLDAELAKVLALPQVRDAFAKQSAEPFYMNSEELGKFLHAEALRYSDILKHARAIGMPR